MKKILHIIDSLGVGGAEKLLIGIINELENYEHHLIILHGPETLRPELRQSCRFLNLNCNSFKGIFLKIGFVKKYIRDNNIDLVHSHLYEANLLARLATSRKVPLINSIHAISSLASYKVNKMSLYLEKLSYKKRHILISVSKAVEDDFEKWIGIKGKKYILYNFIEEKYFLPAGDKSSLPKSLRLVAVGNLRYQKNYPYLLQVFKKIRGDIQLDIYGEGPLRKELQEEIDKHQLPVRLCGIRNDLEKTLPQYDIFVMSSHYEGQPVSLLEAMAGGLPVMLADIPVLREVTGENAVYFNTNDPQSFILALQDILDTKYDLQQMALRGQKRVNEFAHKKQYLQNLVGIYNENC